MLKISLMLSAFVFWTAQSAFAGPNLASYYTTIGKEDFFNSRGQPLRDVGAVVQQDRANFHRFGLRHPGDEADPFFGDRAMRARIPDLVHAGGVDRYLQTLLGGGWQGHAQTWLVQICGAGGRVTHLRIDPADGDGYSDC
ncbi:hypothetical protein GCM10016455_03860 [Aliiroseovarius zhejiangensis]|uniref:Uncharacterized protein n=1 Tax=Aliiroseovarius zhejiangensis TaxID=1632025 RepID=A0ABQ3IP55_9RHOB|nr:hypothetical protein [Aliiroseovarius zhejiangensis]GHE87255.1 hypothetical protein GCM10016455_03860 [Aliiroseovarius zhejiangensis]